MSQVNAHACMKAFIWRTYNHEYEVKRIRMALFALMAV